MKFVKICLVVSWCFVIFFFSSESSKNSNARSQSYVDEVVEVIEKTGDSSIKKYEDSIHFVVRKLAHFTLYFILGVFVFFMFLEFFENPKKVVLYSILFCLCYAMSDEFHQLFTGRSARILDVLIDTTGSAFSVIFTYFLFHKLVLSKQMKNLTK